MSAISEESSFHFDTARLISFITLSFIEIKVLSDDGCLFWFQIMSIYNLCRIEIIFNLYHGFYVNIFNKYQSFSIHNYT